jgi:glycosyltransferase involved in cell wall biosynthesis
VRLAVYTDYPYRQEGDAVYAERAFVLFLGELARMLDRLVLVGRLSPEPGRFGRSHYRVADEIEFVALPHYESLARPQDALQTIGHAARAFSAVLPAVDAVWLLGPHPFSLLFAALSLHRRRPVFLGVRQDLPRYARTRHPGRRTIHLAADALEASYRLLALRCAAIVVGPELAHKYRAAKRLLPISVSLVRERDLPAPTDLPPREYGDELTVLSVGRLETEKNPLLLADVLARLNQDARRWRLVVCGEGPLEDELRSRVESLGISDMVRFAGYVPIDGGLADLYRTSHALLHVSWTEGVPQVLFEAFAAGLPVVATAVGGVPEASGDDALLVPPGEVEAPVSALETVVADPVLRQRLAQGGLRRVREHTIEAECARVVAFLQGGGPDR